MAEPGRPENPRRISRRTALKTGGAVIATATVGTAASRTSIGKSVSEHFPNKEKEPHHRIETGFNTHMRAEPKPEENLTLETFKRQVDLLAANNQQWIRFNLLNGEIAQPGTSSPIEWKNSIQKYDEAIEYAKAHGLKICFVTDVPDFAQNYPDEDYLHTATMYYAHLAKRYKDKIDVWQIFNEPDTHDYKQYDRHPHAENNPTYLKKLAETVKVISSVIKSQDTTVKTTINLSHWVGSGVDLIQKGNRIYDALGDAVDVISLDLYPDTDEEEIKRLPKYIEHFKNRYGKDVLVSELGLPTGRFDASTQGKYTSKALEKLANGKVTPLAVLLYELADETTAGGMENTFGFLNSDGTPKPSFQDVLKTMKKFALPPTPPSQIP